MSTKDAALVETRTSDSALSSSRRARASGCTGDRLEIDEYTDGHQDNAVVPHTLILSPGLRIEKVYVGYWFWGRPTPEQLWADLGEVHARIKPDFVLTLPEPRAEAMMASR